LPLSPTRLSGEVGDQGTAVPAVTEGAIGVGVAPGGAVGVGALFDVMEGGGLDELGALDVAGVLVAPVVGDDEVRVVARGPVEGDGRVALGWWWPPPAPGS